MSLPASEAFTGTGALSGSWFVQAGTVARASDKCDFGGGFSYAYWSGDAFANNQKSSAVCGLAGSSGTQQYTGVIVRASSTDNNYLLYMDSSNVYIFKTVAGAGSLIATFSGDANGHHGVTFKLEVEGTTLRGYRAGSQIGTDQTDSSLSSGSAGVGGLDGGTTSLDDWVGDNIGAAAGTVIPVFMNQYRQRWA